MNILIDGQTLHTLERNRGIGYYFIKALEHLITVSPDNVIFVSTHRKIDLSDLPEAVKRNASFLNMDIHDNKGDDELQALQYRQGLEEIVLSKRIDIYWNPNPLMGNVIFPGILLGCKNLATVHDLIPLNFPNEYLDIINMDEFEDYLSRLLKLPLFDSIIAVSRSTKDDLIRYTPVQGEKITVIYEGVDSAFFNKPAIVDKSEVELRYGLPKDFIFTLSGPDYRKNNLRLIEAFAIIINKYKKNIHLVIGGDFSRDHGKEKEGLRSLAKKLAVGDKLVFIGAMAEADILVIYNLSKLFVSPSLYEGFGLPVLEAMAVGIPVAASNASATPEVLGDAGLYFDPYDVKDMAEKIVKLLEDDNLYKKAAAASIERARDFSWGKTAIQTYRLFESLIKEEQSKKETARAGKFKKEKLRLAFFSPLNPQHSGISDYSEALLIHLKEYAQIDLFVDGIIPSNPEILNNFRYYDYKEFEKKDIRDKYDNIIYQMGNNTLHDYIYLTLQRYPGITVLHDYNIHSFIRGITLVRNKADVYLQEIKGCYGVLGDFITERISKNGFDLNPYRFSLNNKIFKKSRAVIVHSEWAKNQVKGDNIFFIHQGADLEPEIAVKDIYKLREDIGIPRGAFAISCFGDIVHTKRIDAAIKAFSIFRLFYNDARLFLVGRCYPEMEQTISKLIGRYDLKESLRLTGKVSLEDFKKYMKASDVIMNLRYPTMGETSASLLRAMSYGKPVIISNINQFREFPDDCCLKADVGEKEQDMLLAYLIKLKKDSSFREKLGECARSYVEDNCSWEKIAKKYLEVIVLG
ncbi:MAG: glycosyltransferase [Nitrospirae bacterium]|nr:glycosyltransferase [Nitrospirota bacterium]